MVGRVQCQLALCSAPCCFGYYFLFLQIKKLCTLATRDEKLKAVSNHPRPSTFLSTLCTMSVAGWRWRCTSGLMPPCSVETAFRWWR